MVKSYLSRSCCNAFSNIQLQSRLPEASQHHGCFPACSRAKRFVTAKSINVRAGLTCNGRSTAHIRRCSDPFSFLRETELSPQRRANFADLIFQKCSEHASFFSHFEVQTEPSPQSCAFVVDNFLRSRPATLKQRPYFGNHGSHFTRKNAGFRGRECFHP